MGGAKIPGIVVQTPKGVVSEKFGKEEKEENDNETQRCAEILEKAGKKGQKRVRYLGDDTEKEGQKETEEKEYIVEEVLENMEGNYERRVTGKGRRLNNEEPQIEKEKEERDNEKEGGPEKKQEPQTFSEIYYRTRKPS